MLGTEMSITIWNNSSASVPEHNGEPPQLVRPGDEDGREPHKRKEKKKGYSYSGRMRVRET